MIQLNFLNAVAEDDGSGLIVNGRDLWYNEKKKTERFLYENS